MELVGCNPAELFLFAALGNSDSAILTLHRLQERFKMFTANQIAWSLACARIDRWESSCAN
jgi:hypothetical protein